MKFKQQPEDFHVEEITSRSSSSGSHSLYKLTKSGWSTPDALAVVRRRWKLPPSRFSFGGLKDRHAHTIQYFSIYHGPQRHLRQQQIEVEYLGQTPDAYTSEDIVCNRFVVTLRDVEADELAHAEQQLPLVSRIGLPNYFDDQRFGSIRSGNDFVARHLVLGDFEQALRLAIAAPYPHDRSAMKKEKRVLTAHWGDWTKCLRSLGRGPTRAVVEHLQRRRDDFLGAMLQLRTDLRTLHLAAYQSHLWNRILAQWMRETCRANQLLEVPLLPNAVPMPTSLDDVQRESFTNLRIPLPSARTRLEPTDPISALVEKVLAEEGLELAAMKVRGERRLFFSKGDRAGHCVPTDFEANASPDERHAGRHKLKLKLTFALPRGSYASLVVKRLFAE